MGFPLNRGYVAHTVLRNSSVGFFFKETKKGGRMKDDDSPLTVWRSYGNIIESPNFILMKHTKPESKGCISNVNTQWFLCI